MIKKILPAAVLIVLSAGFCLYGQTEGFTQESEIIIGDAQTENAEDQGNEAAGFFTTWDFIKVILILLAVILIVYAVFYALKKAGGSKFENNDIIKLLGSRSLTQNGSLHLIEVGAKYYLVGCSEGSVSHIADIDDKDTVDELMLNNPPEKAGARSFMDFFNIKFGRGTPAENDIDKKIKNNNKFIHDQAERLKKM